MQKKAELEKKAKRASHLAFMEDLGKTATGRGYMPPMAMVDALGGVTNEHLRHRQRNSYYEPVSPRPTSSASHKVCPNAHQTAHIRPFGEHRFSLNRLNLKF